MNINIFFIYTVKSFVKYLMVVSLIIFLLLFLSAVYSTTFSLSEHTYTLTNVMKISVFSALVDINKVIPIIVAVAVMITMIILMRNNELLGYMTIGGSVAKMVIPFLIIGIVISLIMFSIEYKVVPAARVIKDNEMYFLKNKTQKKSNGFYNTWFINQNKTITNIGFVSISEKAVYNVQEYIIKNNKISQIKNIERIYLSNSEWFADNITITNITSNPPISQKIKNQNLSSEAELWSKLINLSTTNIKALTPKELYIMIKIAKEKGLNSFIYQVNLYYKIASALSVIVLVLLLFPISIDFSRNYSIIKNATMTFCVALFFILSQNIGKALGDKGTISPFISTFGPLIIFSIISGIIILRRNVAK